MESTPSSREEHSSNESTLNAQSAPVAKIRSFNFFPYAIAVVVVIALGIGLLFVLERDGRVSTGIFGSLIDTRDQSPVARVNGEVIPRYQYDTALSQLNRGYSQQGVDTSNPEIQTEISDQAITNLIDTEVLLQVADANNITVSEESINERYGNIEEGAGGPQKLAERMAEFGVTNEQLRSDIQNELRIQTLFETMVLTEEIQITDEEVQSVYDNAGGTEAGLPPLTEVRDQIIESVRIEKQQALVQEYLNGLKEEADIEILL